MESSSANETILIVDDEESIRDGCRQALEKLGYQVYGAADGESGIRIAREKVPSLAFIDLKMPALSGMEVIEILSRDIPDMVLVVITGYASIMSAIESLKKGAYDYMPKPFAPDQLRAVARRALDHRRLTIEARRLREEKQEIERNFITFVSHEMRSPLATIQQYMEALRLVADECMTNEARDIIERCGRRIQNLEDLVEHWLDLSRIENGSFVHDRELVAIEDIIGRSVDEMSHLCRIRSLNLETDIAEKIPPVMGDKESLVRVLINIIGNATKYTPSGGFITLKADFDEHYVKVAISDTGSGIPQEKLPFIFEPFYRARGKDDRSRGSGLGLTFCKRIMEAHNGRITVESKEGSGTTFTLYFPRTEESAGGGNGHI